MASIEKRSRKVFSPNGSIQIKEVYRAKIRMKGFPSQSATFDRLTDAKQWVQKTESDIRAGRYQMLTEAQRHTLNELLDRYIIEVLPAKAETTISIQSSYLAWWKQKIGILKLSDVTPPVLSGLKSELAKTKAPATVTYYLACLSHCFSMAVREWHWMESNPLKAVSKPKLPSGRDRFLSEEERGRLLYRCKESHTHYLFPIVMIALSTGARKMEIMNLRWGDINLVTNRFTIHKTKNGEKKVLPIVPQIKEELLNLAKVRRLDTDLVFPRVDGKAPFDIRKAWEKALRESKTENFCFHDLRHSAASYLAMSGATPSELAAVLGHKTLAMVKRYAHIGESHTSDVMNAMAKKFLS